MQRPQIENLVIGNGWLFHQPTEFRVELLKRCKVASFEAGDPVFHLDGDLGGIYGVAAGSFLMSLPTHGPSMRLAHIARAGVWFGHGPALTNDNRKIAVTAAETSIALHAPLAALKDLMARDPMAARHLAALAEFGARVCYGVVGDLLLRRSSQRIAATLLRVTSGFAGDAVESTDGYALTQNQLAEMANVSRDVANRTLALFESRGSISVGYGRVLIRDRRSLAAEAAGEA